MNRNLDWCRSWYVFYKCLLEKRRRQEAGALPVAKLLKLYRDGFFPNKQEMYLFARYDRSLYVSDQQILMTSHINGEQAEVLDDKVLFRLAMGRFVRVPNNFAFVHKGLLIPFDPGIKGSSDVKDLLVREKRLIAKPTRGLGGKGVNLLEYNGKDFLANGRKRSWSDLIEGLLTAGDLIICEYVRQGEFANLLYPHTVNTIRMLSLRDPEAKASFIAAAAFRVGCSRSLPVDNISAGGIVCGIDLDRGQLERAATGFFGNGRFQWLEEHPDTGMRLQGLILHGWEDICQKIRAAADNFPCLPYIAWDVALGEDDIIAIEANSWTDVSIFQIYRPLLLDKRIAAFFAWHHIV
ncbi:MAG: sugar-transfer associated ATP-grasp domain-containing protein [Desulfobacterales bacterium]